ncbi:hypothetical protein GCM10010401_05720 [Rarobacter faecitabidus]|uniref:Uncharacterized protein n=1 Tax=Rarobacter faecitabidus TaxID=13243 RepID=A0A542ZTP0_RARFA|nr:hypothetical protein [Rarobacter faecitabidus]TQL63677.1 hypothetical protein FB461_0145 [Rarobacter faecitabidus]
MGHVEGMTPNEQSWAVADEARGYIANVEMNPLDVDALEARVQRANHLVEPAVVLELINLLREARGSEAAAAS